MRKMYKNKSGELVFETFEEFKTYNKTCKKGVKTTGIRIHIDPSYDMIFVQRNTGEWKFFSESEMST